MVYLLKMVIFHSYVKLPEGTWYCSHLNSWNIGITLEIFYQSRFVYTRKIRLPAHGDFIPVVFHRTKRDRDTVEQAKSGTFMYSRPQKDS